MAELKTLNDLVRELQLARGDPAKSQWGRAVFLIGAGCSRSAGIPLGGEIAKRCAKELAHLYSNGEQTFPTASEFIPSDVKAGEQEALRALDWLVANVESFKPWKGQPPNWGVIYGEIFENHLKAPGQQHEIVTNAVTGAKHRQSATSRRCLPSGIRSADARAGAFGLGCNSEQPGYRIDEVRRAGAEHRESTAGGSSLSSCIGCAYTRNSAP
jgi:hypothetical protein